MFYLIHFIYLKLTLFSVEVVPDPVALIAFARSLQSTRDPGKLYRRFVSHISSLETLHLVGPDVPAQDEIVIRHIVSNYFIYYDMVTLMLFSSFFETVL